MARIKEDIPNPSEDPGFPRKEAPTTMGGAAPNYCLAKFRQKLHVNEVKEDVRTKWYYVDPPLQSLPVKLNQEYPVIPNPFLSFRHCVD